MSNFLYDFFMPIALPIIIGYLTEASVFRITTKARWKQVFWYALIINAATMPLANLLVGAIASPAGFLMAEAFAIIAEIFFIKYLFEQRWGKSILISVVANVLSAVLGFILSLSWLF
ncbi:hypothetical protein JXA12_05490 [Candidatus Woesearchaeota archaeon]|nr:hypothetical protein [Candidatus Woesearchaeota archaeon]